jgi:Spy/CpxP family protein refolding chaperone
MERAMGPHGFHGPHGRWWNNPQVAQKIGLTDDQRKKMDDIFQQHRLKLVDLDANLKREEIVMEPLVNADQPDEAKLLAQIDRVAQARAELEKANARMLLGIRRVLTADQWKKLQEEHQGPNEMHPGMGVGGHGFGGPPMGGPHRMDE